MLKYVGSILMLLVCVNPVSAEESNIPKHLKQLIKERVKSHNERSADSIKRGTSKLLAEKDIITESGDVNGDGLLDWLIYDLGSCGSAGCVADVFVASKDGKLCYVGTSDTHDILRKGKIFPELQCGIVPIYEITRDHEPMYWLKQE